MSLQKNGRTLGPAVPAIAVIVIAAYTAAQMVSDITSVKIGEVAGLAVDMGTFVYPITFTLRDLVHKVLGRRNTQILIVSAALINLFMVAYTAWTARIDPDPLADPTGEFARAYATVWGPLWRITLASIAAEVISELMDTEVYHWWVTRVTRDKQWARVLVSNSVSVPVDNAVFAIGAFGFAEPWSVVWEIFLINLVVKFGVTLLSLPLIYLTPIERRDE